MIQVEDVITTQVDIEVWYHKYGYSYDNPKDVEVIIKAGDNTRVVTISRFELMGLGKDKPFKITYIGTSPFSLKDLKIICEFPVIARCRTTSGVTFMTSFGFCNS